MFKSDRITLRPMEPDDYARQHEFAQNPDLWGLDCGYPMAATQENSRAFFESINKPEETAFFAIEADGKYIGNCALMNLKDRNGNLELGIGIGDPAYWGKGYGREAVRLLLRYGFHYLGARRIVLTTHAKNERAIRCYAACGFIEEGRPRKVLWIEGEYVDLVNMSILRDEWQSNAATSV